jgi:tetratricopeptide (TPR) repeat protein
VMNASDGAGFVHLLTGDGAGAVKHFEQALALFPEHARSLVGLAAALQGSGQAQPAADAFKRAAAAIEALRRGGRGSQATLVEAFLHTAQGRLDAAMKCLRTLIEKPDSPFTGWTLPIEPLLEPLRQDADFGRILATLATRAR